MKNAFKFGFLALAITMTVAACGGAGKTGAADSAKKDSVAADTAKKDSAAADTAKKDTAAKKDSTKKM